MWLTFTFTQSHNEQFYVIIFFLSLKTIQKFIIYQEKKNVFIVFLPLKMV